MKKNTNIIPQITSLSNKIEAGKFEKLYAHEINEAELIVIAKHLKLTKIEALFIVVIYTLNNNERVTLSLMASFLKWSIIKVLRYKDILEDLLKRKYITGTTASYRHSIKYVYPNINYSIASRIRDIILNESVSVKYKKEKSFLDVIKRIHDLQAVCCHTSLFMLKDFKKIININQHFNIIKTISELKLPIKYEFVYYNLIWEESTFFNTCKPITNIDKIFYCTNFSARENTLFMLDFIDEEINPLLKQKLIFLRRNIFENNFHIELSDKSIKLLKDIILKKPKFTISEKKIEDVILPDSIKRISFEKWKIHYEDEIQMDENIFLHTYNLKNITSIQRCVFLGYFDKNNKFIDMFLKLYLVQTDNYSFFILKEELDIKLKKIIYFKEEKININDIEYFDNKRGMYVVTLIFSLQNNNKIEWRFTPGKHWYCQIIKDKLENSGVPNISLD